MITIVLGNVFLGSLFALIARDVSRDGYIYAHMQAVRPEDKALRPRDAKTSILESGAYLRMYRADSQAGTECFRT